MVDAPRGVEARGPVVVGQEDLCAALVGAQHRHRPPVTEGQHCVCVWGGGGAVVCVRGRVCAWWG